MSEPVTVIVARTSPADVQQRQVIVAIDDGPKATLMFGESVTFRVPAGSHVLRSNNTLVWKRTAFTAAPGETIEFVLTNRATAFTLGFLSLIGVAPLNLTIERK